MKYIDKWILVQYVYIFSSSMWLPPISLNQMCTNIRWENCSPCVTWLQCKQANKLQAKTEHNMPLVLYCTALYCTALLYRYCVLYCTALLYWYCVLYCTALHYCTAPLYCTGTVYCTVLYSEFLHLVENEISGPFQNFFWTQMQFFRTVFYWITIKFEIAQS